MIFEYKDLEPKKRYKLMSQTVTPRAIAWITTQDNGILNLAPFSYFTPLSSNPPTLIISIGHKANGKEKDTLRNIRKTKICTISIPKPKHLEKMHFSSKSLGEMESEVEEFEIKTKKIFEDFPPIVDGVGVAFGCKLLQEVDLKGSKTIPIILEIQKQFVEDEAFVDLENLDIFLQNLGRAGSNYLVDCKEKKAPKIP